MERLIRMHENGDKEARVSALVTFSNRTAVLPRPSCSSLLFSRIPLSEVLKLSPFSNIVMDKLFANEGYESAKILEPCYSNSLLDRDDVDAQLCERTQMVNDEYQRDPMKTEVSDICNDSEPLDVKEDKKNPLDMTTKASRASRVIVEVSSKGLEVGKHLMFFVNENTKGDGASSFGKYFTSALGVLVSGWLRILDHDRLDLLIMWKFLPAAIIFYLSLFTNSELLLHANVDTFIVFRSAVPMFVAIGETLFLKQPWPSTSTWLSLATIFMGSLIYVITDYQFTLTAYTWATAYLKGDLGNRIHSTWNHWAAHMHAWRSPLPAVYHQVNGSSRRSGQTSGRGRGAAGASRDAI
ncbi:hypothetical protein HPP92_017564 [Vanilla planifolia]|uniref:Sugar phosphate transporter domain-containing protein n=1 Tax=Vanilla planifolia TaxID=51239 RepID=A0A835QJP6_VANPL|nr:hypothetical protein HPP92_017564 [Vanilla planifolia]